MSLAEVTAKIKGVALHLARADTGGYWCRGQRTDKTLHTWALEKATCKRCIEAHRKYWEARNQ